MRHAREIDGRQQERIRVILDPLGAEDYVLAILGWSAGAGCLIISEAAPISRQGGGYADAPSIYEDAGGGRRNAPKANAD